jgi:hypothetical protein
MTGHAEDVYADRFRQTRSVRAWQSAQGKRRRLKLYRRSGSSRLPWRLGTPLPDGFDDPPNQSGDENDERS